MQSIAIAPLPMTDSRRLEFGTIALRVALPTGQVIEVFGDRTGSVAELKRKIDEREGFAPSQHPLSLRTGPAAGAAADGPRLDAATQSLDAALANLPPESEERQRQLAQWAATLDAKLGKGEPAEEEVAVAGPRPGARLLPDDWDLARCGLREGDFLQYGPWCGASVADGAMQRTQRLTGEQRRILEAQMAPLRAALIALIVRRESPEDAEGLRKQLETKTASALKERAAAAGATEEQLQAAARGEAPSEEPEPEPEDDDDVEIEDDAMQRALMDKLGEQLREAVTRGFVDQAKRALDDGAPVDEESEDDMSTALAIAVTRGGSQAERPRQIYQELVTLLLERGADPNHADARGWTPMHRAASVGNVAALRAMRALRPPRQGNTNQQDGKGWTCLHWCKSVEVAKLLLEELGARDDVKNESKATPEKMHAEKATSKASGLSDFFQARREQINANKKPWED